MMEMEIEERRVEGRGRGRYFVCVLYDTSRFVSLPCSVHTIPTIRDLALVFLSLGESGGKLDYRCWRNSLVTSCDGGL